MLSACGNVQRMAKMIQIRNVPDDIHRTLKIRAAEAGMTLSDYLRREVEQVARRPTTRELIERLRSRSPVRIRTSPAAIIRRQRDAE